jgi:DNA-binding beta-propeller fold protein YncE
VLPCLLALAPPAIGDREDGEPTEALPTGVRVTPTAAPGAASLTLNPGLPDYPHFTAGQPVLTAISPDGKTLLVLTSGYNVIRGASGAEDKPNSGEYVFVYDISGRSPRKTQVLQVRQSFLGLAWNPSGGEFYVSGGADDVVHAFARADAGWREAGPPIALGHRTGLGIDVKPMVAGLAVNAAGTRLLAANFENDSVTVVDLVKRTAVAEVDLRPGKVDPRASGVPGGSYPLGVAVRGDEAYVTSPRDREIVVLGLDGLPSVQGRIALRGQPNQLLLDGAGRRLFAALGSRDAIAVIDTASRKILGEIPTTAPVSVFKNARGWKGSSPNSLALSPDEKTLYVTNGGTNSLAIVSLAPRGTSVPGEVVALVPTGWYPNAVSVSRDGAELYVANGKSPTGPNPGGCRDSTKSLRDADDPCKGANQYVLQLSRGNLLTLPTPPPVNWKRLTDRVAKNNRFRDVERAQEGRLPAAVHSQIKHVIYIVKENRTYDQVLGDLDRGNGDPKLAILPEALTPNHHRMARQFVTLDNFYDSGEVSGEGWLWSTAARTTELVEKMVPVSYARHALSYDSEGTNRNVNVGLATLPERLAANPDSPNDPDLLPGRADVSAPDSADGAAGAGYLWDGARRRGLTVRNYGFFLDLHRLGPPASPGARLPKPRDPFAEGLTVAFCTSPSLASVTDPYFRGFDQTYPDFWRVKEWRREFEGYVASGALPNLTLLRLAHDHFGSFKEAIDGVNTVEAQMADNDYALGLVVEAVSKSRYKDDTLIFVLEDDAQDGADHVDARRSLAFVVGPFVKQGAVVSKRYSTVSMLRTIEDVLGIDPLGLFDGLQDPMMEVFEPRARNWSYAAEVPAVLRRTELPLPPAAETGAETTASASARPSHDAAYWDAQTRGLDFSAEDRLDVARFNRVLWAGLAGDRPYPETRDGRDLRKDRRRWRKAGPGGR